MSNVNYLQQVRPIYWILGENKAPKFHSCLSMLYQLSIEEIDDNCITEYQCEGCGTCFITDEPMVEKQIVGALSVGGNL